MVLNFKSHGASMTVRCTVHTRTELRIFVYRIYLNEIFLKLGGSGAVDLGVGIAPFAPFHNVFRGFPT